MHGSLPLNPQIGYGKHNRIACLLVLVMLSLFVLCSCSPVDQHVVPASANSGKGAALIHPLPPRLVQLLDSQAFPPHTKLIYNIVVQGAIWHTSFTEQAHITIFRSAATGDSAAPTPFELCLYTGSSAADTLENPATGKILFGTTNRCLGSTSPALELTSMAIDLKQQALTLTQRIVGSLLNSNNFTEIAVCPGAGTFITIKKGGVTLHFLANGKVTGQIDVADQRVYSGSEYKATFTGAYSKTVQA